MHNTRTWQQLHDACTVRTVRAYSFCVFQVLIHMVLLDRNIYSWEIIMLPFCEYYDDLLGFTYENIKTKSPDYIPILCIHLYLVIPPSKPQEKKLPCINHECNK